MQRTQQPSRGSPPAALLRRPNKFTSHPDTNGWFCNRGAHRDHAAPCINYVKIMFSHMPGWKAQKPDASHKDVRILIRILFHRIWPLMSACSIENPGNCAHFIGCGFKSKSNENDRLSRRLLGCGPPPARTLRTSEATSSVSIVSIERVLAALTISIQNWPSLSALDLPLIDTPGSQSWV